MKKTLLFLCFSAIFFLACIGIGNTNGIIYNDDKLYMTDLYNHVIYEVDKTTAKASIIAGKAGKSGSANGAKKTARFNCPSGITSDGENLFIADSLNQTIRRINKKTGYVSTLAGSTGKQGSADGTGSAARFNNPNGILYDDGNLYVVDSDNHTIRKIVIATGDVTTFAGSAGQPGPSDGKGTSARFNFPSAITIDGNYLYVVDTYNYTIRKIDKKTGEVSTFAGTAGQPGATDEVGTAAEFNKPKGITIHAGNIYITDSRNNTIRKIEISSRKVSTFVGEPMTMGYVDATGAEARFSQPENIVCDGENLYVTQTSNTIIRKIVLSTKVVISMPEIQ
jgi:hypothetical protein